MPYLNWKKSTEKEFLLDGWAGNRISFRISHESESGYELTRVNIKTDGGKNLIYLGFFDSIKEAKAKAEHEIRPKKTYRKK